MDDDTVNFVLFFLAALAAFCDFLLGESGRRRLRDWFVDAWVHLASHSHFELALAGINFVVNRLEALFHGGPWSKRVVLYSTGFSVIITTIIFITFSSSGINMISYLFTTFDFHVGIYMGNVIGDIFSIQITYLLLRHMVNSTGPMILGKCIT